MPERKEPHRNCADAHTRHVVKEIDRLSSHGLRRKDILDGLLTCSFCSLHSASLKVAGKDTQPIENEYQAVVQRLGADTVRAFPALFNEIVEALEEKPRDVLGEIWSALDCGNEATGQFFTPYTVSEFMARMSYASNLDEVIAEKGYVTVQEPAVGAGGMLIAFGEILKERGHDPTQTCYAEAVDVDKRCVQMTYIQTTLLALPTVVVHGDAIIPDREQGRYANAFAWPMLARVNSDAVRAPGSEPAAEDEDADSEVEFTSSPRYGT